MIPLSRAAVVYVTMLEQGAVHLHSFITSLLHKQDEVVATQPDVAGDLAWEWR